ncbi:prostate stem cell antigen [Neomonachus schauinslandi]|uniref:Prostate stem cell antigen n=1 Tax=Neomonachus schauinslandi TaxID=29088 RepID=A0A2Y9GYR3_NEOSC|nr:prostate stem cell antigen [Neomonachus schauinslandi]
MKAVLLTLLAIGLALRPGTALRCFSCKARASNHDCQHVRNCTDSETYCRTEHIRAVGNMTVISKGCSSHCVEDSQSYSVGKKNITCCSTDLCNANGAHALQPAAVTLALLTASGGLLLWGPSRL